MRKLLVVDDDANLLKILTRILGAQYQVVTAEDAETAERILDRERPDGVICDFVMPGMSGAAFLARVRARLPRTIRVLISGREAHHVRTSAELVRADTHGFIGKPFDGAQVLETLANLFATQDAALLDARVAPAST